MTLLGVTGGVGMGKSMSATLLAERGVTIIDTDLLARQLVVPGQPAFSEIQWAFGDQVIASDGTLDRRRLAGVVFADIRAQARLEAILHPRIRALWRGAVENMGAKNIPIAAVVIPLLVETHAENEFDWILCVACSRKSQHERLRARSWSDLEIGQRIAAQAPIEKKMDGSDFVIWTEGSVNVHYMQVDRILRAVGCGHNEQI